MDFLIHSFCISLIRLVCFKGSFSLIKIPKDAGNAAGAFILTKAFKTSKTGFVGLFGFQFNEQQPFIDYFHFLSRKHALITGSNYCTQFIELPTILIRSIFF